MKLRLITLSSLIAMALTLPSVQAHAARSATSDRLVDADRAAAFELAGRGCGTPEAAPTEAAAAQARVRELRGRFGVVGPAGGTIDVAFHNLVSGGDGFVSDRTFAEQIRVMNQRFAGSGFQFRLKSIDRTDRNAWFRMLPGTGTEKQCKMALAIDPAHTLNVYTCSPGHSLLGWAYFPFSFPEDYFLHGVVIHYGSLPDGFIPNYNLGLTLVHEVGHYTGLFHTFQGGCVAPGDYIDDTPFEASPAFGCPVGRNTCPQDGVDPIHNYMDYTYDECYNEFTPLQLEWMQSIVPAYRPSLLHRGELAEANAKPAADVVAGVPAGASLEFRGAFPNPFTREALLRYSLPSRQHVSLSVYDVAGQRVASLVDREEEAGEHLVKFAPRGLAAGMYFTVLRTPDRVISRSAVFLP
jgi:hypothetical protein